MTEIRIFLYIICNIHINIYIKVYHIYILYIKSKVGKTALHYAIELKSVEIAALLIKHPSYAGVHLTDAVSILP